MKTKSPTISVNIRDSLIMIHKNTLRLLGNTEYIQILVNPTEKTIVLCCSTEDDHLAHHVKDEVFTNCKKHLRIHSQMFLRKLHKIYPEWIERNTYKIPGEFISNLNVVKFYINDSFVSTRYGGECSNE